MSHIPYEQQQDNAPLEQENIAAEHNPALASAAAPGILPAPSPDQPDQGNAFASLGDISNGINSGCSPLMFKQAIDSAQASFGNRATLAFAQQQYQDIHALAMQGFGDAPQSYPFKEQIQQAFGRKHNIDGLTAYTGTAARSANSEFGSDAYHKGGRVAFGTTPTLEHAAHEAAHYVQNLDAARLQGGVGNAGDSYERHADRVAGAVTRGESAASMLDQVPASADAPPANIADSPLQMAGGRVLRRLGRMGHHALSGRRAAPAQGGMHPMVMPSAQDSNEIDHWTNRARTATQRTSSPDPLVMPSGQDSHEIDFEEVMACIADGRSLAPAPIRIAAYILGTAISRYALGQITFAACGPWGLGLSPTLSRFFAGAVALGASALLVPRIMPMVEEYTKFSYAPNPRRGRMPNMITAAGQGIGAVGLYTSLWALDVPSNEIKEIAEGVKKTIPLSYIQNPIWTSLKMIDGPMMEVALKQANVGAVGSDSLFIRTRNAEERDKLGTAPPQGSVFANSLGGAFMSIGCVGLGALDGKILGEIMNRYPDDQHNRFSEVLACSVVDGSVGGAVEGVVRPGSEWLQRQNWRSPYQWYKDRPLRHDSHTAPVMPGYENGGAFDHWTSLHADDREADDSVASSYPQVIRTFKIRENKFGESPVYAYGNIEFTSAGFDPIKNLVRPLPGDAGHRYFAVLRFSQDIKFVQGTIGVHADICVVDTQRQEQGAAMEIMINTRTEVDAPAGSTFIEGNLLGKLYRIQARDVDYNFTRGVAAVVMPVTEETFYEMRDRLIRSMTPKKAEDGAENYPWWELQSPASDYPVNCFNYAGEQARLTKLMDPRLTELYAGARKSNTLREYMAAFHNAFNLGYGRFYDDESSVNRIHIFNMGIEQVFNDWIYKRIGDEPTGFLPDPRIHNEQFGGATADITREFREWIGTKKAYKVNPEYFAGMPALTRAQERHPNAYRTSLLDPFKDIPGPLPGPEGHTDFAYTAYLSSPRIRNHPDFAVAHSSFGLYKTDRPDKGVWVHLIRKDYDEDPATRERTYVPYRIPVGQYDESTYTKGNMFGYISRSYVEEMRFPDKFLRGRHAMFIYPIDNFDEMRERIAESLYSKENIEESGPYWDLENSTSEARNCLSYARALESHMKLTDHPGLEIPTFQTMKQMMLTWEMLQKMGYLRYPDQPDMAERVALFNAWLDQFIAPSIEKRGEGPLPYRFPNPRLHNTAPTKHDPEHSLRVKDPDEYIHTKKLFDPSLRPGKDDDDKF